MNREPEPLDPHLRSLHELPRPDVSIQREREDWREQVDRPWRVLRRRTWMLAGLSIVSLAEAIVIYGLWHARR